MHDVKVVDFTWRSFSNFIRLIYGFNDLLKDCRDFEVLFEMLKLADMYQIQVNKETLLYNEPLIMKQLYK